MIQNFVYSMPLDTKKNKSLFVKHGILPLLLLCHSHSDLYPIDPQISREHLHFMTNVCMKFEKAGPNQTLVIDRTRLYIMDGQMNERTDGQVQRNITPLLQGGHNYLDLKNYFL